MQIWFFMKWIVRGIKKAAGLIVGWFILGRSCRRCKHCYISLYDYVAGTCSCELEHSLKIECLDSLTAKHFERETK